MDTEFCCTFNSNSYTSDSSYPGVKATITLGDDFNDPLSAQDIKHSLVLEGYLSLPDAQIYGLLSLDLTQGFNATSARLLLNPRDEFKTMKQVFIRSLQWSVQQADGMGFAMPEPHFDLCGVADGLGRGVGVKGSLSKKIYRRFQMLASAISLNQSQTDEWYFCFLQATSTELSSSVGEEDIRGYGQGSASDDFVYRLLPFFMGQANQRLGLLRDHRARQRNTQPLITSVWTPMELLQLITGDSWEYFRPMFMSCYSEEQLTMKYELLALRNFRIVLGGGELRYWPIVSIAPRFLSFSGTPYGITYKMLEATWHSLKENTPAADLVSVQQMLAIFDYPSAGGPDRTNLFHFFLQYCVVNQRYMTQLTDVVTLHATCEYAAILPSKPAFDEFCIHVHEAGARVRSVHDVLYLTYAQTDVKDNAVEFAISYIDDDARLPSSVRVTEMPNERVEREKRPLSLALRDVGGDNVSTVVLVFVEGFDMHRCKNRILDIVAPWGVRRVNPKGGKFVLGRLQIPGLQRFLRSDIYRQFREECSKIARPHVSQTSRFDAIPEVLVECTVTMMASQNLDKIMTNSALLIEADEFIGAVNSHLLDNMVGTHRNHRCSILPFFVITDVVMPRDPDLATRRSLTANVVLRLLAAMLYYGMTKVLDPQEIETALTQALTVGREEMEQERERALEMEDL